MSEDKHVPFTLTDTVKDTHAFVFKAPVGIYTFTAPLDGTYRVGDKDVVLKKGETYTFKDENEEKRT